MPPLVALNLRVLLLHGACWLNHGLNVVHAASSPTAGCQIRASKRPRSLLLSADDDGLVQGQAAGILNGMNLSLPRDESCDQPAEALHVAGVAVGETVI